MLRQHDGVLAGWRRTPQLGWNGILKSGGSKKSIAPTFASAPFRILPYTPLLRAVRQFLYSQWR